LAKGTEVVNQISGIGLFADLSHSQLEGVAHTFEEESFPEGHRILRQGFGGSSFHIILDGEVSVQVGGQERRRFARGDFFGEISILLGEAPSADIVVAVGPLRSLTLGGPKLQEFLTAHPVVMYRMLQAEARRVHDTTQWQS